MNASDSPGVPVTQPSRRALIFVIAGVCGIVLLLVAAIAYFAFWMLGSANNSAEHRCALAVIATSPQARSRLGTPIAQEGWTSASFDRENSDYRMEMSFSVAGPRQGGTAYVRGHRSPFESSFQVVLETGDGQRVRLYDGPYRCPVKAP